METGASLLAAFVAGLLSSGHCFAMCGGIAGALVLRGEAQAAAPRAVASRVAAHQLGRLLTYSALGALAGGLAAAAGTRLPFGESARVAKLAAALGFAALALHFVGRLAILGPLERLGGRLFLRLAPLRRALAGHSSAAASLAAGALWGFLPCGLVYSTLLLATTSGGAWRGALTMLAFGAGTVPALVAAGVASRHFARLARSGALRRLAAAACLAAALLLGNAALAAAGAGGVAGDAGDAGPSAPVCHVRPG
jgi:sulfite exporter TauE/SafE